MEDPVGDTITAFLGAQRPSKDGCGRGGHNEPNLAGDIHPASQLHPTPSVVPEEIECAFRAHNRIRPAKRSPHSK